MITFVNKPNSILPSVTENENCTALNASSQLWCHIWDKEPPFTAMLQSRRSVKFEHFLDPSRHFFAAN